MSMHNKPPDGLSGSNGWREHEISQLRQFRALSLCEKMEAVQGMADVVRRFQRMRREGAFHFVPRTYEPREGREAEVVRETLPQYRVNSSADE